MGRSKGLQAMAASGGIMRKKVLVRGPCLSQSGYGEHARMALRALRTREDVFDIYIIPTGWGHTGWISETSNFRTWMDAQILKTQNHLQQKLPFDISLQVTIPGEFEKLAPINIGVTAGIETTKMSPDWIQKSNLMDKIITISRHAKWSFENTAWHGKDQMGNPATLKLQVPVEVVGYPVRDINEDKDFKLELETGFNYLAVGQWGPRKNMENLVKWWLEECWDQPVGLLLKTSFRRNNVMDREFTKSRLDSLIKSISLDDEERQCKIYLVHGDLTESEIQSLYAQADCMITTTHGEGFGLPMFEFALHGKPVIAPDWSGHLDFLINDKKKPGFMPVKYDVQPIQSSAVVPNTLIEDSMWCYPHEGSFKQRLRQVRKSDKWIKRAQEHVSYIREYFAADKINDLFCSTVAGDEVLPTKVSIEDIPKISLITSVFNAKEYIEQLLEDTTRQTIFEDKCEWIILNANPEGHDEEEEIILKYAEKYPNIVYKRLDNDPGIYAVWNQAIKMSTGEFITNINCDDRRSQNALEIQAKTLVFDDSIDLVYNDSYVVHDANIMFEDVPNNTQRYNFEQFSQEAMLRTNLPHNNPMWRKKLHEKNGYFKEDYRSASDWEFWLRCTFEGSQFKKINQILGVYYFNPTGISTNKDTEKSKRKEEFQIFKKYQKMFLESR
jgi:glycosyltransferase involved in cell wall biosynthesis